MCSKQGGVDQVEYLVALANIVIRGRDLEERGPIIVALRFGHNYNKQGVGTTRALCLGTTRGRESAQASVALLICGRHFLAPGGPTGFIF